MPQVIIHNTEKGDFWVECPCLPGCISHGETWDDALEKIQGAIQLFIESLEERNLPIPEEAFGQLVVIDE